MGRINLVLLLLLPQMRETNFAFPAPKEGHDTKYCKVDKGKFERFLSRILVITLFLSTVFTLNAQSIPLRVLTTPDENAAFRENINGFKPAPSAFSGDTVFFSLENRSLIDSFCQRLVAHFYQKAYLLASIDTLERDSGLLKFHLGTMLRWLSLRSDSLLQTRAWHNATLYRNRFDKGEPLDHQALLRLERSLLEQAENNGYPFASVWLDSVVLSPEGRVSALLRFDPNRYFEFKGLKINGEIKIPKAYLPNYLGFRPGLPYSRARVLRLREQLRSVPFLESTSNPSVTFSGKPGVASTMPGEATVQLYLKKKRAGRFDFIIGLLPQPQSGKLQLTGSLSAAFQNALSLGERFSAEIERLKPETQKMDIQAGVPYLFGTAFGLEGRLGIFKRDSTWTDAQTEAGVAYWFGGTDFLRVFWENKGSSLQKIDTLSILNTHRLPSNLDLKQNGFGLEIAFNRLDYRFNPRRGWTLSLKGSAGFTIVRRNSQIEQLKDPNDPGFSFSSLYDSLAGRTARYRPELSAACYLPVFLRSTIKLEVRGGGIFSEKTIFVNESYRLGGNKLLRGFDEERFFATRFAVATLEYRLLTGANSFLSVFTDGGYLENRTLQNREFFRPLGLGAGLNFETKAGIFGISAAVGRQDSGDSFDFRATKFHLGYVSIF